ncbi:DUF3152 domain-containing protein [Kineosporia mesophila]|uniref:DUF3152 domain-containing protein n=1 Tax=Kineosporia mesophila TaxID=566012 RepID=A0ABP6Z7Q2_9ACTN|nr:DUF3152 domain-containing protein [Kineosporia mesophila]MCD5354805.1 DUF3152 domain-containing protein [Kineosporia mesophila]
MAPVLTSRLLRPVAVSCLALAMVVMSVAACPVASAAGARSVASMPVGRKATITYPQKGPQAYRVASGRSRIAGTHGPLLRYRVALEKGITGITARKFARRVVATLSDGRSWVGTGQVRLQRVPKTVAADFTIYLVTPQTRDALCGDATRSDPDRYTSCRNGNRVVLNVARWVHGVPGYGAGLGRYRAYMINHETGHRLGHHHEKCPGAGRPAPVMQQQSLGLHGCTANAWPRVNGKPYRGPAGAYDDPIPQA